MGIQSTVRLTRQQAEERVAERIAQKQSVLRKIVGQMSNEELEDLLESTFDNYLIIESES